MIKLEVANEFSPLQTNNFAGSLFDGRRDSGDASGVVVMHISLLRQ
jgi:hypothetical protein